MSDLNPALEMVQMYTEAEKAVLAGKSITKGDRSWTREDLGEIRRGRREWEQKARQYKAQQAGMCQGPSIVEFGE